jgi:hypothetical protein
MTVGHYVFYVLWIVQLHEYSVLGRCYFITCPQYQGHLQTEHHFLPFSNNTTAWFQSPGRGVNEIYTFLRCYSALFGN